ncbi:hypothetical protein LEMLEM_LOCUS24995 [Lemmus lemmus]
MQVRIPVQKESPADKLDCPVQKETQKRTVGRNSKEKNPPRIQIPAGHHWCIPC